MKVFVTGATGFLGRHVLKRLLEEKHVVSILSRSPDKSSDLEKKGIKIVEGSLDDIDNWKDQLSGVDVVIHLAAPVTFWGPWDFYYKAITLASKKLFESASRQKVKRFIYISSEAALQDKKPLIDIDESYLYPKNPNSNYGRAKKEAEIALSNSKKTNTKIIIIRPSYIWGVGSNGTNALIDKIRSGGFVWIDKGKSLFETSHVENVTEAIMLSLEKGKDKEIYYVTDEAGLTFREYLIRLLKIYNLKIPKKNISSGFAYGLAVVVELVWKVLFLKSHPPLTRFTWAFTAQSRRYNIAKIKKELGYKVIVDFEEGLVEIKKALSR